MKGQAARRILSMVLACALGATSLVLGVSNPLGLEVQAASSTLGPLTHYNGILFSSVIGHQADVEGALAVGGDSTFGSPGHSYDVGGAIPYHSTVHIGRYQNTGGYPTLLLGGLPRFNTTGHVGVAGGPVVMKEGSRSAYNAISGTTFSGTVRFEPDADLDDFFSEAYHASSWTSARFPEANSAAPITLSTFLSGGYGSNLDSFLNTELTLDSSLGRVLSINISGDNVVIGEVRLPAGLAGYDTVVFNFSHAGEVHFTPAGILAEGQLINTSAPPGVYHPNIDYAAANALLKRYAEKIIWNFPKAESIQISGKGIVGSVLAPEADVVATGGSINGMLIADMLEQKGGFELHAFTMRNIFLDPEEDEATGKVRIQKVDQDDHTVQLTGAVFDLYREDKSGAPFRSGLTIDPDTRMLEIDDLPVGKYILVETAAPEGYESLGDTAFVIDEDHGMYDTYETYTIQVENRLKQVTVNGLFKVGSSGGGLADAEFVLYQEDADRDFHMVRDDVVSDPNGEITLAGLTVGTYYLVEVSPPPDHEINPAHRVVVIQVFVDAGGNLDWNCTDRNGNPLSRIENDHNPSISGLVVQVVKLDLYDTAQAVPGAKFLLERYDNTVPDWIEEGRYESGEFGLIDLGYLEIGDYRFMETDAPPGYVFVDQEGGEIGAGEWVYFNVYDNGGYLALGYSGSARPGSRASNLITLYNKPTGVIEITKKDSETGKTLEGAQFVLYRSYFGGMQVVRDGLESGPDGKLRIENLSPGLYFLEETVAPSGYQRPLQPPDNPMTISLGGSGAAIGSSGLYFARDLLNTPIKIDLNIHKVDEDDGNIPLAGAVFELYLYDPDTRQWTYIDTLTSDSGGRLPVEQLDTNKLSRGTYKFVEVKAPDGYTGALEYADGEYIFNINYDSSNPTLTLGSYQVRNALDSVLGAAEVYKVDSGDATNYLAGATFRLYRRMAGESEYQAYRSGLTTGQDGRLRIGGLRPGEYMLLETKAPTGYQLGTDPVFFTISADSSGAILPLDPIHIANDPEESSNSDDGDGDGGNDDDGDGDGGNGGGDNGDGGNSDDGDGGNGGGNGGGDNGDGGNKGDGDGGNGGGSGGGSNSSSSSGGTNRPDRDRVAAAAQDPESPTETVGAQVPDVPLTGGGLLSLCIAWSLIAIAGAYLLRGAHWREH